MSEISIVVQLDPLFLIRSNARSIMTTISGIKEEGATF